MSYKFNNSNRKLNVNVIGQIDIPASILSEVKYGKNSARTIRSEFSK